MRRCCALQWIDLAPASLKDSDLEVAGQGDCEHGHGARVKTRWLVSRALRDGQGSTGCEPPAAPWQLARGLGLNLVASGRIACQSARV
jgi:hypothetical protein